jgi:two-component system NtrC family sensor kinase
LIPLQRVDDIFRRTLRADHAKTDRLFAFLLLAQWAIAIALAVIFSPYAWDGNVWTVHVHVYVAVLLGGALNALPLLLIVTRPGEAVTRYVVAIAQMLWSALLIHLTGGRIETHFHVFGSLAFLAFYRDWRLLPTATLVVAADHLIRGFIWPESVYGIVTPEWWRFLEHAAWVAFEDVVLMYGCVRSVNERRAMAEREASLENVNQTIEREVREKTAALQASVERYRALAESTNAIPWEMDGASLEMTYVSPQVGALLEIQSDALAQATWERVHPEDRADIHEQLQRLAMSPDGSNLDLEYRVTSVTGRLIDLRSVVRAHHTDDGAVVLRGISVDITSQKKLEMELRQAQKLESVGRLAAGVAHEINTPVQFVSDSIHFLGEAVDDLTKLIAAYRVVHKSVIDGVPSSEAAAAATQAEHDADVDYLLEQLPGAVDRSREGLDRVASIVRSMKAFAHPDQKEMSAVDLNQAIQSTLIIARSEYKYVADVETDLGELPPVTCHAGEINQAILNILVNGAHAIGDVVAGTNGRGLLRVCSRQLGDWVEVRISDTGGGIPDAIRDRIFDPFFTTKDVGKGTGQGLAIARNVVLEKHGGALTFETESGAGTTFIMRLPIDGRATEAAA